MQPRNENPSKQLLINAIKRFGELEQADFVALELDKRGEKVLHAPVRLWELLHWLNDYCQHGENTAAFKSADDTIKMLEGYLQGQSYEMTTKTFINLQILGALLTSESQGLSPFLSNFCIVLGTQDPVLLEASNREVDLALEKIGEAQDRKVATLRRYCSHYLAYLGNSINRDARLVRLSDRRQEGIELGEKKRHLELFKTVPQQTFEDQLAFLKSQTSDEELKMAINKYQLIKKLHGGLSDETKTSTAKLANFRRDFQRFRSAIEQRRDSFGTIFSKAVATILTLGIGAFFLFRVKGKDLSKNIQHELEENEPLNGP